MNRWARGLPVLIVALLCAAWGLRLRGAVPASPAPAAVANAAVIAFREGLEAVLILASLMAGLKHGAGRRLRRPLWLGAAGSCVATALTWLLARGVLGALARYGERLEAAVSLLA